MDVEVKKYRLDQEKASLKSTFVKYAVPSAITTVFFGTQNVVDGVVVGNFLGALPLASVNIVLPLFSMIMVVALVIGIGTQTIVSINFGRKNYITSQDAITTGFYTVVWVCLFLTLILLCFAENVIEFLGGRDGLLYNSTQYYYGLVPFVMPIALSFYNDAILKAMGYTKASMIIMISVVILNVLLSVALILVFNMGVMGASLATGISFTLGLIFSSLFIFFQKTQFNLLGGEYKLKLISKAIANGSSEGFSELAASLSILIVNLTMLSMLGDVGVSAFTIINFINFTSVLLFLGISNGVIPILSKSYGSKRYGDVLAIFKMTVSVNLIFGVIIFFLLQFFGGDIIRLFMSTEADKRVFEISDDGLKIFSFIFILNGINISITAFFTALELALYSIVIALLRGVVFITIGLAVFPVVFGVKGVWLAIPLSELLTFVIASMLWYHVKKNKLL